MNVCYFPVGEDVCDPVMNTTMYATADNVFNDELPYACPTASKLTHGVSVDCNTMLGVINSYLYYSVCH